MDQLEVKVNVVQLDHRGNQDRKDLEVNVVRPVKMEYQALEEKLVLLDRLDNLDNQVHQGRLDQEVKEGIEVNPDSQVNQDHKDHQVSEVRQVLPVSEEKMEAQALQVNLDHQE